MIEKNFIHTDLALCEPGFGSSLGTVVIQLEPVRSGTLVGAKKTAPLKIFMQLKRLFHQFESLGSARIEGNRTTLSDYIEAKIEENEQPGKPKRISLEEVLNIEKTMAWLSKNVRKGETITDKLVREIHAMVVEGLPVGESQEGDPTPGQYRTGNVTIGKARHAPPDPTAVPAYMQELLAFINKEDPPQYDLIKIAQAHHRFAWVHPFANGNGRVVRLLTYALLIKCGFAVGSYGGIVNPTTIFCRDRDRYYEMLERADFGGASGQEEWCLYVLEGLNEEMKKVRKLVDFDYVLQSILLPAINYVFERKIITTLEFTALIIAAARAQEEIPFKLGHLKDSYPQKTNQQLSAIIKNLRTMRMLVPNDEGNEASRIYKINFVDNFLTRGVVRQLKQEGFISDELD